MKLFKRILPLMLCVLLVLPLFTAVQALGGEDATYVLNNQVDGDNYTGPDLQYFSPYRIEAVMDGRTITMRNCMFLL